MFKEVSKCVFSSNSVMYFLYVATKCVFILIATPMLPLRALGWLNKSKGGPQLFYTGGTTKVGKNTQNDQKKYPKVLKSTEKYPILLISTLKYPKVPKCTKKHKSKGGGKGFFSQK